jgi:hypothetical protein
LENTTIFSGTPRRTTVSSSPQVKPKLPSPITRHDHRVGRPERSADAADSEKPSAPCARLVMKWRPASGASK